MEFSVAKIFSPPLRLLVYDKLLYSKLRKWAVCGEFCVVIGYPSGQDGAILPTRDCPFHSCK